VVEELFQKFESDIESQELEARGGQIIDATLIPVPRQRNSREDNKETRRIACLVIGRKTKSVAAERLRNKPD
jgi:hypothetical protein